jgi:hypothetical protein
MLKRKHIFIGLLVAMLLIPSEAYAATPKDIDSMGDGLQYVISFALQVLVVLNWLVLSAIEALLDPDVIFGKLLTNSNTGDLVRPMEAVLRNIWVVSRNIVNGIFAFVLLFAGIFMIVKSDGDGMGKVKQAAPKFVLAVILVNFSWFFPRVVLDISNVLTAVVYQLPALVHPNVPCMAGTDEEGNPEECIYVWNVDFSPPSKKECDDAGGNILGCVAPTSNGIPRGQRLGIVDIYYVDWHDARTYGLPCANGATLNYNCNNHINGSDSIINGLAVNFAKLPSFGTIDFKRLRQTIGEETSIWELTKATGRFLMHLIFHVIFSLAVFLALAAFAVVLIVRIAMIWICVAFMPFAFIGFALGKPLGELSAGEQQAPNVWKYFLKYAFIPFLVAIPLSVGFTLISNLYAVKALPDSMSVLGLEFLPGVDTFHELLWMVITIGIIWMGVFSVLESDKVASKATGFFKGLGGTGMKIAGYGIGAVPIMPMPGGKSATLTGMAHGYRQAPLMLRNKGVQSMFGEGAGGTATAHEKTKNFVDKASSKEKSEIAEALRQLRSGEERALNRLSEILQQKVGMSEAEAGAVIRSPDQIRSIGRVLETSGNLDSGEIDNILNSPELKNRLGGGAGGKGASSEIDFGDSPLKMTLGDAKQLDIGDIMDRMQSNKTLDQTLTGLKDMQQGLRGIGVNDERVDNIGKLHDDLLAIKGMLDNGKTEVDIRKDPSKLNFGGDAHIEKLMELMKMK